MIAFHDLGADGAAASALATHVKLSSPPGQSLQLNNHHFLPHVLYVTCYHSPLRATASTGTSAK